MKKDTLKWEFVSHVDDVINKEGRIQKPVMRGIYETVYADLCNGYMEKCGGRNFGYYQWLKNQVNEAVRRIKDPYTSDEDGKVYYGRRWAYDPITDSFVHSGRNIKKQEAIQPAKRANNYKTKQAESFAKSNEREAAAISKQEAMLKKEAEYRAWDSANPALFTYPEAAGQVGR